MQTKDEEGKSRRDFLGTGARVLAFGALGTYAIAQGTKRKRLESDPNCVKLPTCYTCMEFSGCDLEKADKARADFPQGN